MMKYWLPMGLAVLFGLSVLAVIGIANVYPEFWFLQWFRQFPHADKLGHGLIFFVLTYLCYRAYPASCSLAGRQLPVVAIAIAGFCLVEELSQIFIASRTFDVGDLLCDFVGIAGAAGWLNWRRLRSAT